MLSPEQAWNALGPRLRALDPVFRPRREALGRVAAEAVMASADVPAQDVSAMDGFSLRGEISAGPLEITATVAAGDPPELRQAQGTAVRIMTGAPLPEGADRVVPVELATLEGNQLILRADVPLGANIRRRGEIHRRGEVVLPAGSILTPGALALLATHGHAEVRVHREPGVAILPTGDEVVEASRQPGPGQLRDSHSDFLLAACRSLGIEATALPVAPDRQADLREGLQQALDHDVAIITGGVSLGSFDLVAPALRERGCEVLCHGVAMQPGKPLLLAAHSRGFVFALPGNPASAMVGFWLFVRPALRRLMGFEDGLWHGALRGRLTAPLPAGKNRDRFLPAEVRFADGELLVEPLPPQGSHDLGTFARGTALARTRPAAPPVEIGGEVEVLPLIDWPEPRPSR